MLYDSNSVQKDLLNNIQEISNRNGSTLDFSLLTDGLKAEREQGITIDVAYKFFNTPKRKYIIADTPGHVQHTRNMVTGASTAQLAVMLVDARTGLIEQTRRHAYILSMLRLPHIVLAVNKMDLVDYSEERYKKIKKAFLDFIESLPFIKKEIKVIPISALMGDNVVHSSENMPWYKGPSLLTHLDTLEVENGENLHLKRFFVQGVLKTPPAEHNHYRAYSGKVSSGIFSKGDKIKILPSGQESTISKIELGNKEIKEAFPPMSVSIVIEDNIDISRGDLIIGPEQEPEIAKECVANICWMAEEPLHTGTKYILMHGTNESLVNVSDILYSIDIKNFQTNENIKELKLNDLGRIRFKAQQNIFFDSYTTNRKMGSFVLVDPNNFATLATGMLLS